MSVTAKLYVLFHTFFQLKNEKVHFIWTQFSELHSYLKKQAEDSEKLNKRLAEMMALRTCQKGKGFKYGASAELKEILARMDARIRNLYMSLPTNAMVIICTGHGDTAVVRRYICMSCLCLSIFLLLTCIRFSPSNIAGENYCLSL